MFFESLAGNNRIKQALARELGRGAPFHAHIITGASGSGKKTAASAVSAAFVCESETGKPCGICPHCVKAARGTHPDIITILPEGKQTYKVDQIRSIKTDALVKPNEAARKVYIIPDGDKLNAASQNALLKLLEEPPAHAFVIINAENAENLLETVRSRCIEWKMALLTKSEVIKVLSGKFPDKSEAAITEAAERSGGNAGAAVKIIEEAGADGAFKRAQDFALLLASGDEFGACRAASKFGYDRGLYIDYCRETAGMCRAAVAARARRDKPEEKGARALAEKFSAKKLMSLINICEKHIARQVQNSAVDISAAAFCAECFVFVR